jgi:hypothetical protein
MKKLDRRAALGILLGGTAAAAGVAMLPGEAEAAPLPQMPDLGAEPLAENAQIYIGIPRRRRRRYRCWYNRWGRRVCAWG